MSARDQLVSPSPPLERWNGALGTPRPSTVGPWALEAAGRPLPWGPLAGDRPGPSWPGPRHSASWSQLAWFSMPPAGLVPSPQPQLPQLAHGIR